MSKIQFLINTATVLTKSDKRAIYIAGKVSGLPEEVVNAKFKAAQNKLEADGWKVLNPCDFITNTEPWETAMRMAMTLLCMADTVYMLPCWEDSPGASVEFDAAVKFGIPVVFA